MSQCVDIKYEIGRCQILVKCWLIGGENLEMGWWYRGRFGGVGGVKWVRSSCNKCPIWHCTWSRGYEVYQGMFTETGQLADYLLFSSKPGKYIIRNSVKGHFNVIAWQIYLNLSLASFQTAVIDGRYDHWSSSITAWVNQLGIANGARQTVQ